VVVVAQLRDWSSRDAWLPERASQHAFFGFSGD